MKCPTDGSVLVMSERSGVEIDYCPSCRGVWLDRGELDKILERAAREAGSGAYASPPPAGSYQPPAPTPGYPPQDAYGRSADPRAPYDQGRRKKKEHWLSDLFD